VKGDLLLEGVRRRDSFIRGISAVLKSFRIVKRTPGMARYFIIPFVINIAVVTLIAVIAWTQIYQPFSSLVRGSAWYHKLLSFIIASVSVIVLAFTIVILYSIIGSVVAAPFNDLISERVETLMTGARFEEPFQLRRFVGDIARMFGNALGLVSIIVPVNILLLLLNLIPVVGSIAYAVIAFLATSYFAGMPFFDFPLDRRRLSFGRKLSVVWRYRRSVAGVGASFIAMTFIPIVGFLGLNIAAVAATTIFVEDIMPALSPRPDTDTRP